MSVIVLPGGELYEGEVNTEGYPDGYGTVTYKNKSTFTGAFNDGRSWYPGVVRDPTGELLSGYHSQEYLGYTITCDYVAGMRTGYGYWVQPNGDMWEGPYVNDLARGIFLYTSDDGTLYEQIYSDNRTKSHSAGPIELKAVLDRRAVDENTREKKRLAKEIHRDTADNLKIYDELAIVVNENRYFNETQYVLRQYLIKVIATVLNGTETVK